MLRVWRLVPLQTSRAPPDRARFARWREDIYVGGLRCLTSRYSLLLSVWVDPYAEHTLYANLPARVWQAARGWG